MTAAALALAPAPPSGSYFAKASKQRIGEALLGRLQVATEHQARKQVEEQQALAYAHYYGWDLGEGSTSQVLRHGERGELAEVRINKARRAAKAYLSLLLGPRFTWRPQAISSDVSARAATTIASSLLEYEMKSKGLASLIRQWIEAGIVFSEAFLLREWDWSRGPIASVDEDSGQVKRLGDVTLHLVMPWDVVRDGTAANYRSNDWLFVRRWVNQHDLAALFPNDIHGEEIGERLERSSADKKVAELSGLSSGMAERMARGDRIPLWCFFHRPTPSLPFGREVWLVRDNLVLKDKTLVSTYGEELPAHRWAPEEQFDTPYGYSSWWDTLGPQELSDGVESACATNLLTLGTQSLAIEEGTKTRPDSAYGMKAFYYNKDGKPPAPLQLAMLPPQALEYLRVKGAEQLEMLGLNDTFMGNPQTAQMNAQAFALLASMAVQVNSPTQNDELTAIGALGQGILELHKRNASDEREVPVVGRQNKHLLSLAKYTGKMLEPICGVIVEIGNALEQTAPGRMQLAQLYAGMGFIKAPDELMTVLETGRLEPAIQPGRDASLLIAHENERILVGEVPTVHAYHEHLRHGVGHASLFSNPELLADAQALHAATTHVEWHYREFFGLPDVDPMTDEPLDVKTDPQFLARIRLLLGQQPPAMVPPSPEQGLPAEETPSAPPGAQTQGPPALEAPPGIGQPGNGAPPGMGELAGAPLGPGLS